jgi:hypothetical protein
VVTATEGRALLASVGVRFCKDGCIRITDPKTQALVNGSYVFSTCKEWQAKPRGLAKCIVHMECALLVQFVDGFDVYGTPNRFRAITSPIFAKSVDDVPSFQAYCMTAQGLQKIESIVKVLRPSTVPRMVLFFEAAVRLFDMESRVSRIITRACCRFAKRTIAGEIGSIAGSFVAILHARECALLRHNHSV